MKDVLEKLLENPDGIWIPRALADRSCMKVAGNSVDGIGDTNFELATLGDSVLRLCLTDLFLDKGGRLSRMKESYEKDEILVTVIGRHYRILDYIAHDPSDANWPEDYLWNPHGTGHRDNVHKHISTAMEALLGAVYRLYGIRSAKALVKKWVSIVDREYGTPRARNGRPGCLVPIDF